MINFDNGNFLSWEDESVKRHDVAAAAKNLKATASESGALIGAELKEFEVRIDSISNLAKRLASKLIDPRPTLVRMFVDLRERYGTKAEIHQRIEKFAQTVEDFDPKKKLRLATLPRGGSLA